MRKETVNAKTELYAILGDPISHSMSPVIMNSFFDRMEMDKVFIAIKANLDTFDQVMEALRLIDLKGYVFTMPVKESACKFMDVLSPEAQLIGAINCLVNRDGQLIGYNTDSLGFWNAIQEKNTRKTPIRKVFVMGAGGFARSAVSQAVIQGAEEVVVANLLSDTAFVNSFNLFLGRLGAQYPAAKARLIDWDPVLWTKELPGCQIVANATPNGMKDIGDLHQIFPFEAVKEDAIFFDAIYEPRFTRFLKKANSLGFVTVEGIDLLVHQGACSFFNWTGIQVDPAQMKEDILNFMQSRRN